MRIISLALLLVTLVLPSLVFADGIVVVMGLDIKPYRDVLDSFSGTVKDRIARTFVLEGQHPLSLKDILRLRPDLIFAIGPDALSFVLKIEDIPIVYAMVSNPRAILSGERNITGVSMNISAEEQIRVFRKILPDVRKIGVIYDEGKTGELVSEITGVIPSSGLSLVTRGVSTAGEVPIALNQIAGDIDAFWLLPDTTVINAETLEYIVLFSFENEIPILSFSEKYVEMGALLALSLDADAIGKQAARLALIQRIGIGVRGGAVRSPLSYKVHVNMKTARILKVSVSRAGLGNLHVVLLEDGR